LPHKAVQFGAGQRAVSYAATGKITGSGWPPEKPGKVGEFDIGQGKVREIVVCL